MPGSGWMAGRLAVEWSAQRLAMNPANTRASEHSGELLRGEYYEELPAASANAHRNIRPAYQLATTVMSSIIHAESKECTLPER